MVMQRFVTTIVLACILSSSYGQKTLYGKVVSDKSGDPLPYVNIGIQGTGTGTLSNRDGTFTITVPKELSEKQVVFSYIGYQQQQIMISKVEEKHAMVVRLSEAPQKLQPVIVESEKLKHFNKQVGNKYDESSMVVTDSVSAGSEYAMFFEINQEQAPLYIHEISFKVSFNTMKTLKARAHIYDAFPSNGLPGEELLTSNQIITSQKKHSWVKFTFEEAIEVNSDFFIAIEWIFDQLDRQDIYASYHAFRKKHPELITERTAVIDGKTVTYEDFGGHLHVGWSIACTSNPTVLQDEKAYIRYNSFGSWAAAAAIPAIRTRISTRP